MFNIGPGELIAIAAVALIVLGPQRLPQALRQVGRVVGELRRISGGFQDELRRAIEDSEADDVPGDVTEGRPGTTPAGAAASVPSSTADASLPSVETDDDEPETMLLPGDGPEPDAVDPDDRPTMVRPSEVSEPDPGDAGTGGGQRAVS